MITLGLSGGPDPVRPVADPSRDIRFVTHRTMFHDSAAAILLDGEVLGAYEEERLNRVKHTNKFPVRAIQACLRDAGVDLAGIDKLAIAMSKPGIERWVNDSAARRPSTPLPRTAEQLMLAIIQRDFGQTLDPSKLVFVEHHVAHAASAFAVAGLDEALVITMDGAGDDLAGAVFVGRDGQLDRIAEVPITDSLGHFYESILAILGYGAFDQYKVMGLAPYGDPERYRSLLSDLCVLADDGVFKADIVGARKLSSRFQMRRPSDPLTQEHMDLAAAMQETLERAILHQAAHYRRATGLRNLCIAGGVAQNSSAMGKLLQSGDFEKIFIQPAAYDAGCALGAAMACEMELEPGRRHRRWDHTYLGSELPPTNEIACRLGEWGELVTARRFDDVVAETARLLAAGHVVGWAQGRSEFGPRALGNRSILADPRPAANKDRINALVKHRESYRPFAPAVIEADAATYFDLPSDAPLPYMTFVVGVRPQWRDTLGAITHIDGTARVQTVNARQNPRFAALLEAFKRETGLPILLNTSFNHSVEPIVETVDDVITCFLTTGLTYVVIGDYVLTKCEALQDALASLNAGLPEYVRLAHAVQTLPGGAVGDLYTCNAEEIDGEQATFITAETYRLLAASRHGASVGELMAAHAVGEKAPAVLQQLDSLWRRRLITMRPASVRTGGAPDGAPRHRETEPAL